jgi:hypothetical protein
MAELIQSALEKHYKRKYLCPQTYNCMCFHGDFVIVSWVGIALPFKNSKRGIHAHKFKESQESCVCLPACLRCSGHAAAHTHYLDKDSFRGWLHERFRVRFHVRFAANRRCDLLYLRFGVAYGIATVYT